MATIGLRPSLQPGEPAPDFTLPAADREGTISLADYRGRSPLLLGIFRGLYCPLCRRKGAGSPAVCSERASQTFASSATATFAPPSRSPHITGFRKAP